MPRRRSPRSPAWSWGEEAGYAWNRIGDPPDPPGTVPSRYRRLWRSGFLAGMTARDRQLQFAQAKTAKEAARGIGMIRLAKRIEKQRARDADRAGTGTKEG